MTGILLPEIDAVVRGKGEASPLELTGHLPLNLMQSISGMIYRGHDGRPRIGKAIFLLKYKTFSMGHRCRLTGTRNKERTQTDER